MCIIVSRHTRRIGPGIYRELMLYSRKQPSQLAQRHWDMLESLELPLTAEHDLPSGAIRC